MNICKINFFLERVMRLASYQLQLQWFADADGKVWEGCQNAATSDSVNKAYSNWFFVKLENIKAG